MTYIRNVLGLNSLSILDLVQKGWLNWFGHVVRRGVNSHVYRATEHTKKISLEKDHGEDLPITG